MTVRIANFVVAILGPFCLAFIALTDDVTLLRFVALMFCFFYWIDKVVEVFSANAKEAGK